MKIIVPIKQILDPAGLTFRRDKERMFINREEYIIGPGSKAAIEAALQIKDSGEDCTVIALSMGRRLAEDALREALAIGCDQAYLLTDKVFQDANVRIAANILSAAIDELGGADLIIAGRESGDTGAGQVGPRLAQALGYTQVTDVYALSVQDGTLNATRRWGKGFAGVQATLPAVVTVAPEAFTPRLAHGARIMSAYRDWEVTTWTAADLWLEETDFTPFCAPRGESFPPPLEVGEHFEGDPADIAHEAILALRLQKLVN